MSDRGEHRSFYVSILDDPDFQSMEGLVFKLLFALKLMLGAGGIGAIRKLGLTEVLGCSLDELEKSFVVLETAKPGEEFGWILRERNIVWLINGLRHERGLSPKSPQHRQYIANQLKPLGNRLIVQRFRSHYPEWFDPTPDVDKSGAKKGPSRGQAGVSDHRERDGASDSTETDTETSDSDRRFLETFYAGATPERRAKVLSELAAALSPKGVRVRGNDFARAKDRAHLDRCIARTIADEIRIPDRAIVVLMKKLQDEEKDDRGRYPGEANVERDKAVIAKENAYDRARRAAANDWSKDNPDELARLQKTARLNCPAEGQLGDIARNSWLLQEISKRNGFPDYETWLSGQVPMAATA
jgi:hypothetical protein